MSLSGSGPRLSLGERALQEATRRMRAGSPCKRRRLHPQKPLSITDVLLGGKRSPQHSHRCSLSASGRASGQARLRRRFSRLGLTPFTRRNIIGHLESFRERPRPTRVTSSAPRGRASPTRPAAATQNGPCHEGKRRQRRSRADDPRARPRRARGAARRVDETARRRERTTMPSHVPDPSAARRGDWGAET